MLNMKEKTVLMIISTLAAALTASLIRASLTYEVKLVLNPSEPLLSAPVGKPFNVSCQALGGDKSKFFMQWLDSEGNVIGAGIPGVVKDENNSLLLTFTHPKPEDSGTYKCTAVYDNEQNLHSDVGIAFYGLEPVFWKDFENVTVIEGQRAEVYCHGVADSTITYKWYNQSNDEITETSGSIYVSTFWYGSYLVIEEPKLHHEGMYTCSTKNSHGLSSKLYYIAVSPKPDITVVNVSSNSVQFRIVVSGFVEGIEVAYRAKHASEYRTNLTLARDGIYSFENLVSSGSYVFKFRILPLNGMSEWSESFQVILLPGVPDIIISRVEKSSVEFERFLKYDDRMQETIDKYEIKYYSVQIQSGIYWIPSTCVITIEIPPCSSPSYTISGLQQKVYYQIEVRAHTESGYGAPATQKIYIPG